MVFIWQNMEITTDGPEQLFDYDRAFFWRLVIFQIKEESDLLLTSYDARQVADVVSFILKIDWDV